MKKEYLYPNYCPKCAFKFRVFEQPETGWKPLLARYCPFCGEPAICPKCKKPYYECECDKRGSTGEGKRFLMMNEVAAYKEELEKEINELLNLQVVGELKPKEERRLNLLRKEYERIARSRLRKATSS